MEYITIKPEEFAEVLKQLLEIKKEIADSKKKAPLADPILDNQDVCLLLKISKRLLQSWRAEGKIPYSQHQAKIWYKASDIQKFIDANYNKTFKK